MAKKNILVIDDDEAQLKFYQMILTNAGYAVDLCANAAEAKEFLASSSPHLIILDIYLGDEVGLKLLKDESLAMTQKSKVIVASSYSKDKIVATALVLGASNYLVKPINSASLLSVVKKTLHEGEILSYQFEVPVEAKATCPGELDSLNESHMNLQSSIIIHPGSDVEFESSKLITDYELEACKFTAHFKNNNNEGQYSNILNILGISEKSKQHIRKNKMAKKGDL